MKNTFRGILILGFIITVGFFFTAQVSAAGWYVDKDASGANNGTSWANAWKSFSSIKWGANGVQPGDTVYLSGGYSSKTYTEYLDIPIKGTSSARISIRVGQDAGHNGTVVFEAKGRSNGIMVRDYTTIDGSVNNTIHIIVRNAGSVGIHAATASTVYGIIIKYVELADNGNTTYGAVGASPGFAHGIRIPSAMDTEIAYNNIHGSYKDGINYPGSKGSWGSNKLHDNYIHNVGDDGIQSSGGIDAWNNVIHDGGPYRSGAHPDGFQLMGNYIRVWGIRFTISTTR